MQRTQLSERVEELSKRFLEGGLEGAGLGGSGTWTCSCLDVQRHSRGVQVCAQNRGMQLFSRSLGWQVKGQLRNWSSPTARHAALRAPPCCEAAGELPWAQTQRPGCTSRACCKRQRSKKAVATPKLRLPFFACKVHAGSTVRLIVLCVLPVFLLCLFAEAALVRGVRVARPHLVVAGRAPIRAMHLRACNRAGYKTFMVAVGRAGGLRLKGCLVAGSLFVNLF